MGGQGHTVSIRSLLTVASDLYSRDAVKAAL